MARTVDQERRDRLVDAAATDLVDNGLVGASLERLARASRTSARMLVHHFGTRDALVQLALERARQRQLEAARAALPPSPDFMSQLDAAWPWFADPQTRRYFKLFSQVASAELSNGRATVRGEMAREWLELLESGFAAAGFSAVTAQTLATILAAQLRGLFLDLDATDDERRVARAYRQFVELLRSSTANDG